jgi:hypothetical protein
MLPQPGEIASEPATADESGHKSLLGTTAMAAGLKARATAPIARHVI